MEYAEIDMTFFVPCLNEEGNVGRTIDNIVEVAEEMGISFEVMLFDDNSSDGTVAEARERCRKYPQMTLHLVENKMRRGLGRNYFIAANRAQGKHFMLVNGDAAEPVESIQKILSHMGEGDAIVPYFGANESRTWSRRILSLSFTFIANIISGHRLRYYNGPVLHLTENVRMWFAETAGFGYQAELMCRLMDEGISVLEVQISNSDRDRGASKAFALKNLLSVANTLFHIFLRRMENKAFRALSSYR